MTNDKMVHEFFNLTQDRATELIKKYCVPVIQKFLDNKCTNGEVFTSFVELDELTTNEKCFLTYRCTAYLTTVALVGEPKARLLASMGLP